MDYQHPKARVLAFYLPQYYPIPENDEWWGKGFTEWTNVGKAKPLFPGHYQPHIPSDLGYYDLRVPETRQAQADLARKYGVEGFVYWHYWFGNGKRLLERPFNEVLTSGEPDYPFALAWANESWSGTLHGLVKGKILMEQNYFGDEDYIMHFNAVLPAFRDKRYITCEGKPIFIIYRFDKIPDISHFIELWRRLALDNGLPGIYFICMGHNMDEVTSTERFQKEMETLGFDAVVYSNMSHRQKNVLSRKVITKIRQDILHWPHRMYYDDTAFYTDTCRQYNAFPTLFPNWDHTARSGVKGSLFVDANPKKFCEAMERAVEIVKDKPFDNRFIFVKSWNEWGEGNFLEPDLRYGCGFLEAIRKAVLKKDI